MRSQHNCFNLYHKPNISYSSKRVVLTVHDLKPKERVFPNAFRNHITQSKPRRWSKMCYENAFSFLNINFCRHSVGETTNKIQ